MSRIESPALQAAESKNAVRRSEKSTEALIAGFENFINQARRRKGLAGTMRFTKEQQERLSVSIQRCVDLAR